MEFRMVPFLEKDITKEKFVSFKDIFNDVFFKRI